MAQRIDLAAYQEAIAARLAAAEAGGGVPALLGFEAGGERWLVDLSAAGEVLPVPELTPVPLTRDWFAGLANVHGELAGVVDFARFCGLAPAPRGISARLICIGTEPGYRVALLVSRLLGVKRADGFAEAEGAPALCQADWCGPAYTDASGGLWRRLEVEQLLADPVFLDAALPES
ncbi:MAG: chemotaxis protein CheW [Rhodocyclaceae bacterium]|nr:chemotaxis protein CheW [Rhodocyclaceae bacterium]